MPPTPLANKVAIVTGAGRGIGRAIAIGFAEAGARVVCAARTQSEIDAVAQTIQDNRGEAIAVSTDVTDYASVQHMLSQTLDTFSKPDILVVNAGNNLDRRDIFSSNPEDWAATIQLNLMGAYYCIHATIPHMRENGGQIITIGSGLGHRATAGRSAYATSKAGLWMLTRAIAEEVWEFGICINELIPGPVLTSIHDARGPAMRSIDEGREWAKEPEDVVPLALMLASQPSHGATGQSFSLMRRDSQ